MSPSFRALTGPAQNRLYPGHQNLRAEGLGNIFIHAQIKSLQLILLVWLWPSA